MTCSSHQTFKRFFVMLFAILLNLAVLICTMGALVLLLLSVTRQARLQAAPATRTARAIDSVRDHQDEQY